MITIIGVDCAVQPAKTGLALAQYEGPRLTVTETKIGSKREQPEDIISQWLSGVDSALICLDAPLGWPDPLKVALKDHEAGLAIEAPANELFRRRTDDFIATRLGKRPLDVGADRIARTAWAAVHLLGEVRRILGQPVPLAWTPGPVQGIQAIEVYPAATRRSLGVPDGSGSLAGLEGLIPFAPGVPEPSSEHARDAVVCALAGFHFLEGQVLAPTEDQEQRARREGWIWSHSPTRQSNQP